MDSKMKKALIQIAQKLNSLNIVWAVGASVMLHHHGLYDDPNDIDIFIKQEDMGKAKGVMDLIGKSVEVKSNEVYSSDYFYKYDVHNIGVDLISGYQINHADGVYRYHFDENSIGGTEETNGVLIHYCSLEDWQTMYSIMPNGKQKAKLIAEYLDQKHNKA